MRTLPILSLLVSASLLRAQAPDAAAPAPRGHVEVHSLAVQKHTETLYKSDWGSYEKAYERESRLAVRATTMGHDLLIGRVEWFFIGHGLLKTSDRSIVSTGSKEVTIPPGAGISLEASSNIVKSRDDNFVYGTRTVTGKKIEGWVVRLVAQDGRVLDQAASSSYLIDWLDKQPPAVTVAAAKPQKPAASGAPKGKITPKVYAGIPDAVMAQIRTKAAQQAPDDFAQQEQIVKTQAEAYKRLHP